MITLYEYFFGQGRTSEKFPYRAVGYLAYVFVRVLHQIETPCTPTYEPSVCVPVISYISNSHVHASMLWFAVQCIYLPVLLDPYHVRRHLIRVHGDGQFLGRLHW